MTHFTCEGLARHPVLKIGLWDNLIASRECWIRSCLVQDRIHFELDFSWEILSWYLQLGSHPYPSRSPKPWEKKKTKQKMKLFLQAVSNRLGYNGQHTDSTKINRPEHNIRTYWPNFQPPNAHVQQNIFVKTPIEVCSLHLYASFGSFCVQFGKYFTAQWVFEHSEEMRNRRHFPSMTTICWLLKHISKTHCASNNWPIWTQKVPKEA